MLKSILNLIFMLLMLAGAMMLFMGFLGFREDFSIGAMAPVLALSGLVLMIGSMLAERKFVAKPGRESRGISLKTILYLLIFLALLSLFVAVFSLFKTGPEGILPAAIMMGVYFVPSIIAIYFVSRKIKTSNSLDKTPEGKTVGHENKGN